MGSFYISLDPSDTRGVDVQWELWGVTGALILLFTCLGIVLLVFTIILAIVATFDACKINGRVSDSSDAESMEEETTSDDNNSDKAELVSIQSTTTTDPVNCLIAVDNVLKATAECGTPTKISLSPHAIGSEFKDPLLEPLLYTRHIFIREYHKPLKWPMPASKKYQILNSSGNCMFFAAEKSIILNRLLFFRSLFPFVLNIINLNGETVMEIQGGSGFCTPSVTVKDSRDQVIGKIIKIHRLCSQSFSLRSSDGSEILTITGPDGSNFCLFADCANDEFDVNLRDGQTSIGKICSQWEYALEDLTGVFVPMKLDEASMSLLLGAVFLIDFSFYQRRRDASCFGRCFLTFSFFALFILLLYFIAKK